MTEELQRHIDKMMNAQNNRIIPEFEGYSPVEMQYILYDTFGKQSPIQLQNLSDADYMQIPIFNQIKYLIDLISKTGELKLTAKGFLPTKIVADIYSKGFIKDELIEKGISKLYRETDCMSISLTRILIEIGGVAKKRKGKLSLTKSGKKTVSDDHRLLKTIFETFATKFNWAYYDGFGENKIGQFGIGFSLILLSKYGHKKQLGQFYAEKYLKAFPNLIKEDFPKGLVTKEKHLADCYSLRTYDRFLAYFGLINIGLASKLWSTEKFITKTDLYDRLIKCTPHNNG